MKLEKRNTAQIVKWAVIAAVLVFLFTGFAWGSSYVVNILRLFFLYLALAQMWNLLSGYTGLVSLGQQAFVGLGGYAVAVVTQVYKLPVILGVGTAIVVSIIFALVISLPIFKMKGVYFTIGTWIVAEALSIFFVNWGYVNYGIGYNITVAYKLVEEPIFYFASFGVGIGAVAIVYLILRSKLGLALMAMRDNESAAEVRGVKLYRTKLICFLIASTWIAIAGCMLAMNQAYIKPTSAFSIEWTIAMTFMVIIGGIGTIEGPILGALVYVILRQYLYEFPGWSNLILGAIAIVIIIVAPKGVMGYLNERFGWDVFSVRRSIHRLPSRPAAS